MKSLHTIQVISRIGYVISKIVHICCSIAGVSCAIGVILLRFLRFDTFTIGNTTVMDLVSFMNTDNPTLAYAYLLAAFFICSGEVCLARRAVTFFSHELDAGTPFTSSGATEMLHLGIAAIIIPIMASTAAMVSLKVINSIYALNATMNISCGSNIKCGIMFIIGSVLIRAATDLIEARSAQAITPSFE